MLGGDCRRDEVWDTWMEVKGNTHDLVFTN
jgi:hypothetical protein